MKRKIFSVLFALVLILSFSMVTAVPAPVAAEPGEAETELVSFSRHYVAQSIMDCTDFYLAIGLAPANWYWFTPPWPPEAEPILIEGPNPSIASASTYDLFRGMTDGAFLFEDIPFGSFSLGETYTVSSVSDDPDFDDFAALLTNGTDEQIWEAYIWPMEPNNAGGMRCSHDPGPFFHESHVFSGTDVGTDFPGWTIQSVSLTFDQIYLDPENANKLVLDYTVDIYAGPPPLEVEIDIKPGSDPNSINLKSKGVVPVAVLTTEDFDSNTVDSSTVEFAGASPVRSTLEDVDGDSDLDMLFHFKTQALNLTETSTEATLTGITYSGDSIEGTDTVNIVPKGKGGK